MILLLLVFDDCPCTPRDASSEQPHSPNIQVNPISPEDVGPVLLEFLKIGMQVKEIFSHLKREVFG